MKVLIANIGNSDVYYQDKRLDNQREKAIELLRDLEDVAGDVDLRGEFTNDIDLPLLEAAIEKSGGSVDLLVAFVTDQPISSGEKNWQRDTVEVGKLIKKLYEEGIGKFAQKVKNVELIIINKPPNIYDEMIKIYPALLQSLKLEKRLAGQKDNEVFISVTAGTPACNIALLYSSLNSLSVPGRKRYLYTSEQNHKAEFMELMTVIGRVELLNIIDRLLERWDYSGINRLLDTAADWSNKHLMNMLKALESRLNLRFEDMDTDIGKSISGYESDEIFKTLMDERNQLMEAIDSVDSVNALQPGILFNELYWSMRIRYEVGNYVDFGSRFFRLAEGLARYEICRMNKCSVEEFKRFPGLEGKKDSWGPSRSDLYQYIYRNKNLVKPCLYNWLKRTEKVIKLRHGTIHDMKGLSQRVIQKSWKGDILEDTKVMLEDYFGMEIVDPFQEYNSWIQQFCRKAP